MCVSIGVRVATITTRTTHSCAPYIGTLLAGVPATRSLFFLRHETLPVLAPLRAFAPLHVCAFALLFALVSAVLLLCLIFVSALRTCSPLLSSSDLLTSRPRLPLSLVALDFYT